MFSIKLLVSFLLIYRNFIISRFGKLIFIFESPGISFSWHDNARSLQCFIAREDRMINFFSWIMLTIFPWSLLLHFSLVVFIYFLPSSLPFSPSPSLSLSRCLFPDWLVSKLTPTEECPEKLPIKYVNSICNHSLVRVLHQTYCGQPDTTRGVSSIQQGRISNLHHHNVPVTVQGLVEC